MCDLKSKDIALKVTLIKRLVQKPQTSFTRQLMIPPLDMILEINLRPKETVEPATIRVLP